MKNCSCPVEIAWACVRSEWATYSTDTHTLIVCHTEGLWCSSQNELNRKEHREGRERWLPLKNKIREWSRQRASWDKKLRYETTYCWPCFNSSFCFHCSGVGLLQWVMIHKCSGVLSIDVAEWPGGYKDNSGLKFSQPQKCFKQHTGHILYTTCVMELQVYSVKTLYESIKHYRLKKDEWTAFNNRWSTKSHLTLLFMGWAL